MTLLQRSAAGGVMILVILTVRALTVHRLPKKTFLALWAAAWGRLLLPFSLPSGLSIYSLLDKAPSPAAAAPAPVSPAIPAGQAAVSAPIAVSASAGTFSLREAIWLAGLTLCAAVFAAAYWKCYREFQMSLPVENSVTQRWLREHPLRRRVSIRQSDRISSPLTFGVLRPVILMPKETDWTNEAALQYVLEHEWVHIQRFDTVSKLLLIAVACVHWFNPLVWIMYLLANRDLGLSCDETVVRRFGSGARASYARVLICMEETRSGLTPLCNHFSKNVMEERITAIMKTKKTTAATLLLAATLVAGTVTVFATSAQPETDGSHPAPQTTTQAAESSSDAVPDPELLAAGLTYQKNSWYYQGKAVVGMYDDNGGIYTDDASADGVYLAVKRGSDGKITEFSPITQKEFRELVDRHMNLFLTETYADDNTLMSYMDPTDGKTYYSFDDGKTFEPLTDAEFEACFPTPDITWWTYDEYKAWLEQEKVQLQSIIGETARVNGKEFTWTQEEIDKTIAMYEKTLEDIKNGILYSKSVDDQEDVMVIFTPADVVIDAK